MLTDVVTRTNLLTFEPDLDHRTGLLSPIAYALQRGILLRRENLSWAHVAAVTHGFESYAPQCGTFYYVGKIPRSGIGRLSKQRCVVLRHRNTVVGGKCALPSALLFWYVIQMARL